MAITDSDALQQGSGGRPASGTPGSRRRHPWRRWTLFTATALVASAVVVLAILAGTYQPV